MKAVQQRSMVDELVGRLVEVGNSDLFAGSVKSLKELSSAIESQEEIMKSLKKSGDNRGLRMLLKDTKKDQQAQIAATQELIKAQEELATISKEQNKEAYDSQLENIKRISTQIKNLAKESTTLQASATSFGKMFEDSLSSYERVLKSREERYKEVGKAGAKFEEGFAKKFDSSVSAFTSGVGNLDAFGDTFIKGVGALGTYLALQKSKNLSIAKTAGTEEASDSALGMADMLGKFSKIAGTLAIVGGSIMMLVKLFQFVEGTVIEANKKLLEGTGILDLMTDSSKNVQENMELVRNTFRDSSFATEMGIALDETLDLVTSFEKLNIGIKQFGGGKGAMQDMKGAMKVARGEAYAMGISMDEASQYMADLSFNLGLSAKDGAVVARMADSFASIRDMALQSGYQTANFFKKVNDLTGSLDNMNYRTEEAGTLLIRFAKVLGKSGLDAALQQLFTGFRGEGYLDQLKRNMLSKSEEMRKATEIEAKKAGQRFLNIFGAGDGSFNLKGQAKTLVEILGSKAVGADTSGITGDKKGGQELARVLGELNSTQRQAVQAQLANAKGVTPEMRAELYKTMRLARGARAGASDTDRFAAQEEMGAMGNARSLMSIIQARVGDANLGDLSYLQKEGITKFGVSKDQIEIFAQLQETFKGQFAEVQRIAKDKTLIATDKEQQIAKLNAGVKMKDGKLVMSDTEDAVEGYGDFFQAQADVVQDALDGDKAHQMTSEQFLAQGVQATTSVFNVLNNTIAGILNTISQGIYSLTGYFFGQGEDATEKAAKAEVINKVSGQLRGTQKGMAERTGTIGEIERKLASLGLTKNKTQAQATQEKALKKRLAEEKAQQEKDAGAMETLQEQMQVLQTTQFEYKNWLGTEIGSYNAEEIAEKSLEKVHDRRSARGVERGLGANASKVREREAQLSPEVQEAIERQTGVKGYQGIAQFMEGKRMGGHLLVNKDKADADSELIKEAMVRHGISYNTDEDTIDYNGTPTGKRKGSLRVAGLDSGNKTTGVGNENIVAQGLKSGASGDIRSASVEANLRTQDVEEFAKQVRGTKNSQIQDAKNTKKINTEITKDGVLEAMNKHREENQLQELKDVAEALGFSKKAVANMTRDQLAGNIASKTSNMTQVQISEKYGGLRKEALTGNQIARSLITPTKADDILITDDGQVWKLDRSDQITPMSGGYAMSKPGGAIDTYIGQRMGTGGGGVTINVNGAMNPEEVGRVVLRHIKDYQASSMGGVK